MDFGIRVTARIGAILSLPWEQAQQCCLSPWFRVTACEYTGTHFDFRSAPVPSSTWWPDSRARHELAELPPLPHIPFEVFARSAGPCGLLSPSREGQEHGAAPGGFLHPGLMLGLRPGMGTKITEGCWQISTRLLNHSLPASRTGESLSRLISRKALSFSAVSQRSRRWR